MGEVKVSSSLLDAALSITEMFKGIIRVLNEENKELKGFLRCLGYTMVIDERGKISMRYKKIGSIKSERRKSREVKKLLAKARLTEEDFKLPLKPLSKEEEERFIGYMQDRSIMTEWPKWILPLVWLLHKLGIKYFVFYGKGMERMKKC